MNTINRRIQEKNLETAGEYNAKCTGNNGELLLSNILNSLTDEYHIINDVLLKTKGGTTQIDHIIVSPYGIFIIETKNYKGMIFGDESGKVWTQVLFNGRKYTFYSPVLQNSGHITSLSERIAVPMKYMAGAIVFTGSEANLDNVCCPYCFTIEVLYDYITSFRDVILSEQKVYEIITRIDKVNIGGYINNKKHIEYVKSFKKKQ